MNIQAPEKRIDDRHDERLDVQSIFYTIQGEGPFCGVPAVFIRLAGCNLQCPGCDTDYTSKRRKISVDSILAMVRMAYSSNEKVYNFIEDPKGEQAISIHRGLVVITGGEPFRQNISELIWALVHSLKCYVQIETNGTLPPPPNLPFLNNNTLAKVGTYVVCSPKTGRVHPEIHKAACCYKYVMQADSVNPEDGLPIFALNHTAAPQLARPPVGWKGPIYLQPMDESSASLNQRNLDACIISCMKFGYTLQLQIHKILDLE